MKHALIILLSLITQLVFTKTPEEFSYQVLLLNSEGYPIDNRNVEFLISIGLDKEGIDTYYQEIQNIQTDKSGIFNFNIGEGETLLGSMDDIEWLSSVPFIGIKYDLSDGQGMKSIGFTQFNSVPFCFYSKYVVCQDGPDGRDGLPGPQGITGATGPNGATGPEGASGAMGASGIPQTPMLSSEPSVFEGRVYLDDGTNTEDGNPGFRYYDGTNWIQL